MTAFAIGGRPHRADDRIRFMSGARHGRRRHRHGGPGYAFGRRAGRGDIRAAILALLAEEPMHGYQIIQELTERTGGVWRPSPGSVYPTLQQLEDEELVRESAPESGKRVYELTDDGRKALAGWIETPVSSRGLKDEFFMKFVVLASARLAEPRQLLEEQRREYLQSLRDLNALLEANGKGPAAELLVEGAILHLKADLDWLELIEQRLALKEER